jgi:hypothetical protein
MLKQPLKYLLLWLFPLTLFANHIHWQGDYNKALREANLEHKSLLVLVVKKDDNSSHNILKTALMNHSYIDTINKKMKAVIVTYEGKVSYPIEMYYTTHFPTLFFVNPNTETFITKPLYGYDISKNSLIKTLKNLEKLQK